MIDENFYKVSGPFKLKFLATIAGAKIRGSTDIDLSNVAPIETANEGDITFLDNPKYIKFLSTTKASVCILNNKLSNKAPPKLILLQCADPYTAYAKIARLFYPLANLTTRIDSSAKIHKTAKLSQGVRIGPNVVIENNVFIGENTNILANSVIGSNSKVGKNCVISSNVSIYYALIGSNTIIHSGVSIGQDGFGFAMSSRGHTKVPQLGRVLIGNDVEIGSNTCIDRGSGPDTIIGDGTKIDNLVQIAHNVTIGKNVVLAAQVGIAGSAKIGNFVAMAGHASVAPHIKIEDYAQIGGNSGVTKDVMKGTKMSGTPAIPLFQYLRQNIMFKHLLNRK